MQDVKLCPVCTGDTSVYNSRSNNNGFCRHRVCNACGHKFKTYEISETELKGFKELKKMKMSFDPGDIAMYKAFKQLFNQPHTSKN